MNTSDRPSPACPTPAATADAGRAGGWGRPAAAALIALLAFVLASTPARHSAVWAHLANGRALAELRAPRPAGLLLSAGEGAGSFYPLYDLWLFFWFRLSGGAGVVVVNALLAAGLAVCGIRLARGRPAAGLGATLSVLALAPWLGLTPTLPAAFLFSLTLLVLTRVVSTARATDRQGRAAIWWLPVITVCWANTDRTAVLGPIAVGLTTVGLWTTGQRATARTLGLGFLVVAAASLLGPNHVRLWTVLAPWGWEPMPPQAVSPFSIAWYRQPPFTGLAYLLLVLMGLAALSRRTPHLRIWAPLWLGLLGLGIWRPSLAPFFAVLAGPVAAGAWPWPAPAATPRARLWRRGLSLGRSVLGPVVGLALLAAAWPGWLAGSPYGHPEWAVDSDPSLVALVDEISGWHRRQVFGADGRGLTLSPQVDDYWRWFGAPDEPGITRPGPAAGISDLLAGILGERDPDPLAPGWRDVLRKHEIKYLVVGSGGPVAAEVVMSKLAGMPDEWALLELKGRAAVFGWRDPAAGGAERSGPGPLNLSRRAFSLSTPDLAPPTWPGRGPGRRPWWSPFVTRRPPTPADQEEASLYLAYFDGHRKRYQERSRTAWLVAQGVGVVAGLAPPLTGPLWPAAVAAPRAIGVPGDWEMYSAHQDEGPPELPLLAVRAARRSLAQNPDDPRSYYLLGEAYLRMSSATQERAWRKQLPAFDRIRQVQTITAFRQALILRPDSPGAHGRLARLYRDRGSLDLALDHLSALVRVSRDRGPPAGEAVGPFRESLAALEHEREGLAAEVRRREAAWEAEKGGRRVLDLARDAAGRGLVKRALDILLTSDASEFGAEGAALELDLLLWAGRVEDVRAWLDPELERTIGASTYHEIAACLAAATGDYRRGGQELDAVAASFLTIPGRFSAPQHLVTADIARAILAEPVVGINPLSLAQAGLIKQSLSEELGRLGGTLERYANVLVVSGLVLAEEGQVEAAVARFRQALGVWIGSGEHSAGNGIDFAGRPVAQAFLRLVESGR